MSEETEALANAIHLSREELINDILFKLGFEDVADDLFQELVSLVKEEDTKRFKYSQALQSQEIVESVLKDRLE